MTTNKHTSVGVLLIYGGLALPLCIAETPIIAYLPAFYARELHLGVSLVGLVFLLARLWDGVSDILVGWTSDLLTSRFGRRKPFVVVGAPLLMASTWFLCNPPKGAGLIYLSIWVILFYASFTSVKVPHISWGTELATEYVDRSRVTTYREAFTMIGFLLFVTAPLVMSEDESHLAGVLFLIAVVTLVTVPMATVPLGIFVGDPIVTQRDTRKPFSEFLALARNSTFMRYLIARLLYATEEGVANSLLVFSFSVGFDLHNKLFQAIFFLYVANLLTMPITLRLARKVDKHRILAIGLSIQACVYLVMTFAPAGNFNCIVFLYIIVGCAGTAILSMPSSILADIIDRGEADSGSRSSGAYVAVDNLIYKLGMALGVGISFGLLGLFHFDPSAEHHSAADVLHIRLLGFALPCILSAASMVVYLRHPITREMQQELRQKLESRRSINDLTSNGEIPAMNEREESRAAVYEEG